jgi:nucleoid-associated protein YgaU
MPAARARVLLVVSLVGFALAGCGPRISHRVDEARAAVDAARTAGVPERLPSLFRVAEENLKESQSLLAQGDMMSLTVAGSRAAVALVAAQAAMTDAKLHEGLVRVEAEAQAARQEAGRATAGAAAAAEVARTSETRSQQAETRSQQAETRSQQAETRSQQAQVRVDRVEREAAELKAQLAKPAQPLPSSVRYVVKQGDTLRKIAARPEIYGDAGQWGRIYEANRDIVGKDRKLRPGQVLVVQKP